MGLNVLQKYLGRMKLLVWVVFLALTAGGTQAQTSAVIQKFITEIPASDFFESATAYGPMRQDIPVVPLMNGSELLGYVYITSDFVSTTGYSGKPIHVMVAIDTDAILLRADLVKHSEPIVLIGIPNHKIKALTESYSGLDIVAEAAAGGSGHDLDIISGATVTIMIIDDSIVRSGIKVARLLRLGGLNNDAANAGPTHILNMDENSLRDWISMAGDGTTRRMILDVGQINEAFAASGDDRVLKHVEPGNPEDTYIELHTALVSAPSIGRSLLGEAEYSNLVDWLEPGEQAILLMGRGSYSYKGSGYVRGGIFDRIQLIQGDISVRFRDRQQRRLGELAAAGSPTFSELDIFKIPSDAEFDPTKPWRIQLLAQRVVGPVEKTFLTFDLGYNIAPQYLTALASPVMAVVTETEEDAAARAALWKRIWNSKTVEIGVLVGMLTILTGVFFFQFQATRHARVFYWFRIGFLAVTLVFLGWDQNAQLSVVNLMALSASLVNGLAGMHF